MEIKKHLSEVIFWLGLLITFSSFIYTKFFNITIITGLTLMIIAMLKEGIILRRLKIEKEFFKENIYKVLHESLFIILIFAIGIYLLYNNLSLWPLVYFLIILIIILFGFFFINKRTTKLTKEQIDLIEEKRLETLEKLKADKKMLQQVKKIETKNDEFKKILKILDNLLEKLPEQEIDKFIHSKDFELYKKVLEKHGIK